MKVKVKFFAYFRELFVTREKDVAVPDGAAMRSLLEALADTPRRREELFAGEALKPLVIVMKNGTSIRSLGGLDTPLAEGDTVAVFPFVAGG
jgi:molybdopterin synthase sulfur carrier subunit